ncbi:MAG: SDR family oxidoreductase [Verrucomicrobia bacterium]|nr:SDR family oxidoreductase [Verrucomicrobiota bacterium]
MNRLAGKVALITGGAGAIGLAAAKLLLLEGASVVLVDVSESRLRQASLTLGSDRASSVVADVTTPEDTRRYVQAAVDRHGGVDVLLANAGIEGDIQPLADYPLATFDRVLAVNVRGVFLGLQQVIPVMAGRGSGSIVITSSILGLKGAGAGLSAYAASKHAVVGLMRTAAIECAPLNIRVNTVHPAFVEGRMMERIAHGVSPNASEEFRQQTRPLVPLSRYGTPDEVAQLMLFLASDESRFCTGGTYTVDGGMSAT